MRSPRSHPETDSDEDSPQQRRLDEKRRWAAEREDKAETDDEETVLLTVFRYDPDVEGKREPRFDEFHVPYERGMTVLDALIYARDTFDPSLTFRHSCRMAVCGSDGFFINGRQRLGCQTQLSTLQWPVRVEPLPHEPVIKDLVVDMDGFYERMEAVEPYFQPSELPESELEEQRQSPRTARRSRWPRDASSVAVVRPRAIQPRRTTSTSGPQPS